MINPAATTPTPASIPRPIPAGSIPLLPIEGTAYECGSRYAECVLERYPGYQRYLNPDYYHQLLSPDFMRLAEARAPFLIDLLRGICAVADKVKPAAAAGESRPACSAFGVAGALTLDGHPIAGQTKDTDQESAALYIVVRLRMRDAPTMLMLAYPGEILGYGFWTTGAGIFRNSLYSRAGGSKGLSMEQWGLLALAGPSAHAAAELAQARGLKDCGNCLITDKHGDCLSVEFNAGGVNIIPARNGIAAHTNHPIGKETAPWEDWGDDQAGQTGSRRRLQRLNELLDAERGRLTAPKAMMCLADHQDYPHGLCRHAAGGIQTTAAVVAEPTLGRLHVVRSNPCANWPVTYCI